MPATITVSDFAASGCPAGFSAFLPTAWGEKRVSHIRFPETDPWAVCPDGNAGFGESFMVCRDWNLILRPEVAK